MNLFKDQDFNKKLLSLVLPLSAQQLLLNLVGVSDAVMLGLVGQNALSAVSLASYVQFVFGLILAAVTIGAGIFAAQYWGKGDFDAIAGMLGIALRISVPAGAAFTVLTGAFPGTVMRLFEQDASLISLGAAYLRAVSPSYLLCGVSQVFLCVLKSCGSAKKCITVSAACVGINIALNALLIFGLFHFPALGVTGAAIATVITRMAECVWAVVSLYRTKIFRLPVKCLFAKNRALHRDFWKYTSPVLANELVWGLGFTMSTVIMGHLGADAAAANAIAATVKNLAVCFCIGIAGGSEILVGHLLGAGELQKAKDYGGKLCKLSVLGGIVAGVVILAAAPLILRYANVTDGAREILRDMLLISAYYMIGKSVNSTTIAGIFCAGGRCKIRASLRYVCYVGRYRPAGIAIDFCVEAQCADCLFFAVAG